MVFMAMISTYIFTSLLVGKLMEKKVSSVHLAGVDSG